MALFLFHNNGQFDVLDSLFTGTTAYAPDVVLDGEVAGSNGQWAVRNAPILAAPWLRKAPVVGADARFVTSLLNVWGSQPPRDQGEAEVIALCMRHGWIAITDDARLGRPELERRGCEYAYVLSLLLFAAASGHAGLTGQKAWEVSQAIQVGRAAPYLNSHARFNQVLRFTERAWKDGGEPAWPRMLADWRVDVFTDLADGRNRGRPRR